MMKQKTKFMIGSIVVPIFVGLLALLPWVSTFFTEDVGGGSGSTNPANQCLLFDGENDLLLIPDVKAFSRSDSFTVELWVKPTAPNRNVEALIHATAHTFDQDEAVTLNSGWMLSYRSDQRVLFLLAVNGNKGLDKKSVFIETQLKLDKWQHIAATYDTKDIVLYLDGEQVSSAKLDGNSVRTFDKIVIGNWAPKFKEGAFHGQIDEVRLWNYARSKEEVQSNRFRILDVIETGLAAYWKFDQKFGQTAPNSIAGASEGVAGLEPKRDQCDPSWVISDCPVK